MIRPWVQLFRVHLIALSTTIIFLGFSLTHEISDPELAGWIILGILWGCVGNIHNAVADYHYDRKDPYKQHFPLVNGSIKYKTAKRLTVILLIAGIIYGLILIKFNHFWSMIFLLGVTSGLIYNWTSKKNGAIVILSGLTFSTAFLLAAMVNVYELNTELVHIIMLLFLYLTIQFTIMNGYSGGYKDIAPDPTNLVKALGVRLENGILKHTKAERIFILGSRTLLLAILIIALTPNIITYILYGILMIITCLQIRMRRYNKHRFMTYVMVSEFITYYMLISALTHLLDIPELIFLILFPITALTTLNLLSWKTLLVPKT